MWHSVKFNKGSIKEVRNIMNMLIMLMVEFIRRGIILFLCYLVR